MYSSDLTTYPNDLDDENLDSSRFDIQMDAPVDTLSYMRQFTNYMGITEPQVLKAQEKEDEAPTVFSYSLYYVYYD